MNAALAGTNPYRNDRTEDQTGDWELCAAFHVQVEGSDRQDALHALTDRQTDRQTDRLMYTHSHTHTHTHTHE